MTKEEDKDKIEETTTPPTTTPTKTETSSTLTPTKNDDINIIIHQLEEVFINNPNNIEPWICSKIIPLIKKHQTINLLDNFNWRTIQVESTIKSIWPGFKTSTKRSGPDSWNTIHHDFFPSLNNIEIKTTKSKTGEFQFDKQTDPQRRQATLLYDGFIFAMFSENTEELLWILLGVQPKTVEFIRKLLQKEQDTFLADKEAKKRLATTTTTSDSGDEIYKLGRDTIGLTIKKLLKTPHDDDDKDKDNSKDKKKDTEDTIKWNFFNKGNWSFNITSSQIISLEFTDNIDEKVTRRCGICREIGHNKSKCPKNIAP